MNITVKGTNVIVLYGDAAASRFLELINRWSGMISPTQWDTFQFILAGTEKPKLSLSESAARLVGNNNTTFFNLEGPAPDTRSFHNLIFDQIRDDNLHLHLVIDVDEKALPFGWLNTLIQSAVHLGSVSTHCLYYLFFGRNSDPSQREELQAMLRANPGTAIFLGDTQERGGRVLSEDRWHAAELALLMNSAEALPISEAAFSLGYAALNANGAELRLLRESAACRALLEEMGRPIQSLPESDLYLRLLPEEQQNLTTLSSWLQGVVRKRTRPISSPALKNAWVTIRMDAELSAAEAVSRMKKFADLNYAANQEVRAAARAYAEGVEDALGRELRHQAVTACLAPEVMEGIADAFQRMVAEAPQPVSCTFPARPFLMRLRHGEDDYLEKCRAEVMKSIRGYVDTVNLSVFAAELAQVYRRMADWLRRAHGVEGGRAPGRTAAELLRSIQKELDGSDEGNALRLMKKYRGYQKELELLHPDLRMLTENMQDNYYQESGEAEERAWRGLVKKAGANLEQKLPLGFRGDFFRVLGTEFDTAEERERFFDEYLSNGPRMYRNLTALQSNGTSVLLADGRLTDQWFMRRDIYEVRTDNAENLTLFPLGGKEPAEYLMEQHVYFLGTDPGGLIGGESLFSGQPNPFRERMADAGQAKTEPLFEPPEASEAWEGGDGQAESRVRLEPDEKNAYRLYWPWNRNDPTAMVELYQFGERIGRAAVISVLQFRANGENMNVTSEVMEGRPLPPGKLTVTIRDSENRAFVENAPVQGKREIVQYQITNTRLKLRPENAKMVSKIVLRTLDAEGTATYYPLYPAAGGEPWLYEGLSMSHGRVVVARVADEEQIYPVRVE